MAAIFPDRECGGLAGIGQVRGPLGHYELRARLGEGGQGEVYEAWDSKLCRGVAIKCVKLGNAGAANLWREARHAASLRHAAFVKVYAIEDDGGGHFIVMELVRGRTLRQVLEHGAVDVPTALDWTGQIAQAMIEAHASGLVHGDLKPSNLMLEADGTVRILDFGLAARHDMLETTSLPVAECQGTIAYMAPERLLGAPLDARADVYALGLVLYELVCGTRPFGGLNGLALAAAQIQSSSDGWSYPPDLGAPLIAVIRAMTARRPELRLDGMRDVLAGLARVAAAAGQPVRRRPLLLSAPLPRRALRACGAALALALLAGAAWQGAPRIAALLPAPTPYSEALEIERGLAGLKLFDRPGSLEEADRHFGRVLERSPDSAAAVAGMSLVHSLRYAGDRQDRIWLQRADAGAQQALALNDQLALSHIALGWVLDHQGRTDPALRAHERALQLDPANFFAWYGKVQALRHARRHAEALESLDQARRRFPLERVFADELGSVYYEQADYANASLAFRRSIALQPDTVVAYANLSATLLCQNRGDDALRVLQQGLQVRPSAKLYGNLGNALFLRGDYVGAAQAFENAVSPARGSPGEYLNWANLADTLRWLPGREQQARQAYERARRLLGARLAQAPDDVLLVSRMGLYSARAGDRDAALALMARAVALAPGAADVQFRAALVYELLGNRAMALEAIARARGSGYPARFIEAEPDLVALRRDPAYRPD